MNMYPKTILSTTLAAAAQPQLKVHAAAAVLPIKKHNTRTKQDSWWNNDHIDKWYIKDMSLLGLIKSIATIAKDGENFKGELRAVHKNKSRKERKKINEALKKFSDLRERLLFKLSSKQKQELEKTTFSLGEYYFREICKLKKPNLELMIVHLLYLRFNDQERLRKNKPHKDFDLCKKIEDIFIIANLVEKTKIDDEGIEYQFARSFITKLNEV